MQAFEYANPTTVHEAVGMLGARWGEVDVLAGGADLLSLMKENIEKPRRLVNIKNIKELGGIQRRGPLVRIGATVTLDELAENADIRKSFPALTQAALGVSSPQIRNMGTVAGDLCQRPRCWYFRNGFGLLGKDADGKSLVPGGENKYHAILGNSGPAYFVSASSLGPALMLQRATFEPVLENAIAFCYDCPPHELGMAMFYRLGLEENCRMQPFVKPLRADRHLTLRLPRLTDGQGATPITRAGNRCTPTLSLLIGSPGIGQ